MKYIIEDASSRSPSSNVTVFYEIEARRTALIENSHYIRQLELTEKIARMLQARVPLTDTTQPLLILLYSNLSKPFVLSLPNIAPSEYESLWTLLETGVSTLLGRGPILRADLQSRIVLLFPEDPDYALWFQKITEAPIDTIDLDLLSDLSDKRRGS